MIHPPRKGIWNQPGKPAGRSGQLPVSVLRVMEKVQSTVNQIQSQSAGLRNLARNDLRLPPVPPAIEADGIVEPAAHLAPVAAAFETEPGNSTGIRSNTRRDCSRNSSGIAARKMQPASQSTAMPLRYSLQRSAASFTANPRE